MNCICFLINSVKKLNRLNFEIHLNEKYSIFQFFFGLTIIIFTTHPSYANNEISCIIYRTMQEEFVGKCDSYEASFEEISENSMAFREYYSEFSEFAVVEFTDKLREAPEVTQFLDDLIVGCANKDCPKMPSEILTGITSSRACNAPILGGVYGEISRSFSIIKRQNNTEPLMFFSKKTCGYSTLFTVLRNSFDRHETERVLRVVYKMGDN